MTTSRSDESDTPLLSLRGALESVRREPLVLFLALGVGIFALDTVGNDGKDGDALVRVTVQDMARLEAAWTSQYTRAPTPAERAMMLEDYIREEILYREALKLGLDRDDAIVRRRLAQKLAFLTEDLATMAEPEEAELRAYYEAHRADYERPPRVSFVHVYFSMDRADAEARAQRTLAELAGEPAEGDAWRRLGDPFMLQPSYAERSRLEIAEHFGTEFADAVMGSGDVSWIGPVPSLLGLHLVRVTARFPAETPPFEEVRERVAAALQAERREAANRRLFEELRARYEVVIEAPEAEPAP